jgi:hypothetical protein
MPDHVVLFCGPSLAPSEAQRHLPEAVVQGPARCGDVYRAVRQGAAVVGIVDGYFDHTLSVWHKEVLWALSNGVRVYGASSMGALRAAELAAFGMIGVGQVFAQFQSGELLDDDEVAVIHESAERGYRAQSDAMVNLRATLCAATEAAVLTQAESERLARLSKELFYPFRNLLWVKACTLECFGPAKAEQLTAWLASHGLVNQKQADAVAMCARIHRDLALGTSAPLPSFAFEETDAWCTLKSRIDSELGHASANAHAAEKSPAPRVSLEAYTRSLQLAAERALAMLVAESERASVDLTDAQAASEAFRKQRGLLSPAQTQAWLREAKLDVSGFSELIHDTVLYERYEPRVQELILRQLPNALRILGIRMPEDE